MQHLFLTGTGTGTGTDTRDSGHRRLPQGSAPNDKEV